MKLYVMRVGTLQLPKLLLVDKDGELDVQRIFTDAEFRAYVMGNIIPSPVPAYLIETDEGYILFDTGNTLNPSSAFAMDPTAAEQSPVRHLEKLGIKTEEIKYIVCSHLHSDHSGFLMSFPLAKIIVHENELNTVREHSESGILAHEASYSPVDAEEWFKADLNWDPVDGVCRKVELVPGVDILVLGPGHTYGMLGLLVHLEDYGPVVIASDAIYCDGNIHPEITRSGLVYDETGAQKSVEYLLQVAEEKGAELWYGHDVDQFSTLKTYDEGFYC